LERLEPAHGAEDALVVVALVAKTLHDLKVSVAAGAFDAEIPKPFPSLYRIRSKP